MRDAPTSTRVTFGTTLVAVTAAAPAALCTLRVALAGRRGGVVAATFAGAVGARVALAANTCCASCVMTGVGAARPTWPMFPHAGEPAWSHSGYCASGCGADAHAAAV